MTQRCHGLQCGGAPCRQPTSKKPDNDEERSDGAKDQRIIWRYRDEKTDAVEQSRGGDRPRQTNDQTDRELNESA